MPFQKGNPGGPGRPPKLVEEARRSVLLRLFDEAAEEAVVKAQIRKAKQGDTPAATWLWDRKYGKVRDQAVTVTITPAELAALSDEELDRVITQLDRR